MEKISYNLVFNRKKRLNKKGMALVDGHGNFGSIEGDGAAAMRYTEAKLKKFTQDVYLADLDKDVVDFVPNFDETEKEHIRTDLVCGVSASFLLCCGTDRDVVMSVAAWQR